MPHQFAQFLFSWYNHTMKALDYDLIGRRLRERMHSEGVTLIALRDKTREMFGAGITPDVASVIRQGKCPPGLALQSMMRIAAALNWTVHEWLAPEEVMTEARVRELVREELAKVSQRGALSLVEKWIDPEFPNAGGTP